MAGHRKEAAEAAEAEAATAAAAAASHVHAIAKGSLLPAEEEDVHLLIHLPVTADVRVHHHVHLAKKIIASDRGELRSDIFSTILILKKFNLWKTKIQ